MQVLNAIVNLIFSKQNSFTIIIAHIWVLLEIYWLERGFRKKTSLFWCKALFQYASIKESISYLEV